jgi:amino acid transporter
VSAPTTGARLLAGTRLIPGSRLTQGAGQPLDQQRQPIPRWAFYAVAFSSFGGPLALAALGAPSLLADAGDSAGLTSALSIALFAIPLWIWLRYAKQIHGSGGLFAFVEAAAGRRLALIQAAVWTVSYVLYLLYTSVQIVYDLLPAAVPGERAYQTPLALLIPIAVAAVMIAGRAVTLIVFGLLAGGQLILTGILDGVTLAHVSTPLSSFGAAAPAGALTKGVGQSSLLYVCGSLPLFLGGELARPARTIRRGLTGAFALTGLLVLLATAPLASMPGILRTAIPGVTVAQQFSSQGVAEAIGIGVALSTAGLILLEYLAITRLLHAAARWRVSSVTLTLAAAMVASAPLTLIDPDGFYSALIKPSLIALWVSQLIVFAAYPSFAAKRRRRMLPAFALSAGASGLAIYGLLSTLLQQTGS